MIKGLTTRGDAALGGHECDPLTIIETIEPVSHADGSAGWTTLSNATPCARGCVIP
jgi:hypothetical protein